MKNFEERREGFLARNLNDLRFAARVIQNELRPLFKEEELLIFEKKPKGKRRVLARPGSITGTLRYLWGLNRLKYLNVDGKKERIEDERHHAVDAMVLAACTESLLQRLTKAMQKQEEIYAAPLKHNSFSPPWDEFPAQVFEAHKYAPVARSENRRARGAGHAATIRQIRAEGNNKELRIVYERVAIDKLTKASLERLKDPDRNRDVYDNVFAWIAAGKPVDNLPTHNNGYTIKKVTLRAEKNAKTERAGFEAHGGLVDNAAMVRVDVFAKDKKFYLVPIYAHQVADRQNWPSPPNKAIIAAKTEEHWTEIDENYTFKFSLYPFSWVEAVKSNGEIIDGYYRGTSRSTSAISISQEISRQVLRSGIGAKTLHSFKKYQVDRLGNKTEIKSEVRTWHGVVCT